MARTRAAFRPASCRWQTRRPQDVFTYRDLAAHPPTPVTGVWVHAAFTPPPQRTPWMQAALAESDTLVDELVAADVIVIGVPMYKFGMPSTLKAWIDNIIRVGRTFGFDRSRADEPYLANAGGSGQAPGAAEFARRLRPRPRRRLDTSNHVEAGVMTSLRYIGITSVDCVAVEYDEFADERLLASMAAAEAAIDALVMRLAEEVSAARDFA